MQLRRAFPTIPGHSPPAHPLMPRFMRLLIVTSAYLITIGSGHRARSIGVRNLGESSTFSLILTVKQRQFVHGSLSLRLPRTTPAESRRLVRGSL